MIERFLITHDPNATIRPEACKHVPSRRPDEVTDYSGANWMLYRCIRCCREVTIRLDGDDKPDAEYVGIFVVN